MIIFIKTDQILIDAVVVFKKMDHMVVEPVIVFVKMDRMRMDSLIVFIYMDCTLWFSHHFYEHDMVQVKTQKNWT